MEDRKSGPFPFMSTILISKDIFLNTLISSILDIQFNKYMWICFMTHTQTHTLWSFQFPSSLEPSAIYLNWYGSLSTDYACVHMSSVTQSCTTSCDPMEHSPPGSSVHKIIMVRILEWCHFLLQEIFLAQGSNLYPLQPLHRQADSLPLSHLGSPSKLAMT